jgi:hypothetical protein
MRIEPVQPSKGCFRVDRLIRVDVAVKLLQVPARGPERVPSSFYSHGNKEQSYRINISFDLPVASNRTRNSRRSWRRDKV